MQVKRFVAADMRRALEMVRQELGSDAVILSSSRVEGGVELLTTVSVDDLPKETKLSPENCSESLFGGLSGEIGLKGGTGQSIAEEIEIASKRLAQTRLAEDSANEYLKENQVINAGISRQVQSSPMTDVKRPAAYSGQSAAERYLSLDDDVKTGILGDTSTDISVLQEELAEMRAMFEEQLVRLTGTANTTASFPSLSGLTRRLSRIGLPESTIDTLLDEPLKRAPIAKAWPHALSKLAQKLPVLSEDVTAKGGVFAFVGPTGAGKTTTIAKLAARYVFEHGADKVALITTDTYRIAAHDQLRSLASILQVPVRVVDENNPLENVLRSLRRCPLVLIDTAGLRHGDPELKQQMAALANIPRIQSYLVMSTNSQEQMLKASIHAYRSAGLKGCVLTKLDETTSIGGALGVVLQESLPIAYTTNGQDIPRDLEVANSRNLVTCAVKLVQNSTKIKRTHSL